MRTDLNTPKPQNIAANCARVCTMRTPSAAKSSKLDQMVFFTQIGQK